MPMFKESDYPEPPKRWWDRLLTWGHWLAAAAAAVVAAVAIRREGGKRE